MMTLGDSELPQEIWVGKNGRFVICMTAEAFTYEVVVVDGFRDYLDFVRMYLWPLVSCYSHEIDKLPCRAMDS